MRYFYLFILTLILISCNEKKGYSNATDHSKKDNFVKSIIDNAFHENSLIYCPKNKSWMSDYKKNTNIAISKNYIVILQLEGLIPSSGVKKIYDIGRIIYRTKHTIIAVKLMFYGDKILETGTIAIDQDQNNELHIVSWIGSTGKPKYAHFSCNDTHDRTLGSF